MSPVEACPPQFVKSRTCCASKLISHFLDLYTPDTEIEILLRIIRLDIAKIRQYIKDLLATKGIFEEPISAVGLRIAKSTIPVSVTSLEQFLEWFEHILAIKGLPSNPEPEAIIPYIKWAQEAKKYHLDFLKAAFSTNSQQLPRWIYTIFKLGRYGIASRALIQLASEFPGLFNPMIVEPILAPSKTPFTFPEDEMPLTAVLRRVAGNREMEYRSRLASVWNTVNPEEHFRTACSLNLTVHAEIQLVNYYNHNQQSKPSFRFIGVSKKSCYLCHIFLATHPDSFCTSSCHQKLYVSWMPPPAADLSVYRRYKAMTVELSKVMEATAKQDLDGRLGSHHQNIPADSTAGVSLSGLTQSSLARTEAQVNFGTHNDSAVNESVSMRKGTVKEGPSMMEGETAASSSFRPVEVADVMRSSYEETEPAIFSRSMTSLPTNQFWGNSESIPISAMVFHFIRDDNTDRQDIVSMGEIIDSSTDCPSWMKLVDILKADDNFGLAFQEGYEFLLVNNQIRVGNERQFLACLQYLRNLKVLNSQALVCSG